MALTIYHNPRCSKSRLTLEIIRRHGQEPEIVEYLKNPPSASRLDALCRAMAIEPLAMMRTKEPLFKQLGLSKEDRRTRADWLRILAANPSLIERPIVIKDGEAIIGRPPERVQELL